MIKANNPSLKSWVEVPVGSDFPIQNLPFGIFKTADLTPRVCTAIGTKVMDLQKANELGFFTDLAIANSVFSNPYINDMMALGKEKCRAIRDRISELLDANTTRWNSRDMAEHLFYEMDTVELLLPMKVTDYTDFYSSIEHATNVGMMFRDPENALLPNWKHIPIGYHGRASSIIVSGTPVRRPKGQQIPNDSKQPFFGPCR